MTSAAFQVPPPMTQVRLVLDCAQADPTTITYTGPTSSDTHDPVNPAAVLTDQTTGLPVPDATVTLRYADQTCVATTDAAGTASCIVTPTAADGPTTAQAAFAGTTTLQPSTSGPVPVTLLPDETSFVINAVAGIAAGQPAILSAVLTEDGETPLPDRPVSLTLGDGTNAQTCTATTDPSGTATCAVDAVQPLGPATLSASFTGDSYEQAAAATTSTIVFAYIDRGAFVIADGNAIVGSDVTFWSPQWCAQNGVSGSCSTAFKGYADAVDAIPYIDGGTWTARPGASGNPPNSLPTYMAVITTTSVAKSGSTISGVIAHVVVVKVAPGWSGSRGSAETGQIVAVLS